MDVVQSPDDSGDALIDEGYGDMHGVVGWNEWKLWRDGEQIMWGEGIMMIDITDATDKGYKLIVGDHVTWSNHDGELFVLLGPNGVDEDGEVIVHPQTFRGLAYGTVARKMIPAASPDVTAVLVEPAESLDPIDDG